MAESPTFVASDGPDGDPPRPRLTLVGYRFSPLSHQTRDFLVRNCVAFEWLDIERDQRARQLLSEHGVRSSRLPVVRFPDSSVLVQPTNAEIAEKIGLRVKPGGSFYDLVIVGGGPAGLAAAVYSASEGLATVMVERSAPGGQAGLSAMIENYLGFPEGLTGADLARRAVAQARKFDVEIVTPQDVTGLRLEGDARVAVLGDRSELRCQAVLLAMGVDWRRLDVPGIARLTGAGVYYGGTIADAVMCRNEDVYIVGGANAAGQAAMHFSRYARTVTMLVRGDSLSKAMSHYLMEQIQATGNLRVRLNTTVVEVHGQNRLEAITIRDAAGMTETIPTNALFLFIGARPPTEGLEGVVQRDHQGFIVTGPDLPPRPSGWSLDRRPFPLETSVPGIFAAGDVRHGSVKRVAAGVGEGATAVQCIHTYMESPASGRPSSSMETGATETFSKEAAMTSRLRIPTVFVVALAAVLALASWSARAGSAPERYTAFAVDMGFPGRTTAGPVEFVIERYSSDEERDRLMKVLVDKGPDKLLDTLQSLPRVGYFRTPNSIGYDIKFAHKHKGEDGGDVVTMMTDRYIGFWEAANRPRTIDYPFTLIEIRIGPEGKGEGKMSLATKVMYDKKNNTIVLEDYKSQPVILNQVSRETLP